MINSHEKNMLKTKNMGVDKRLSKWREEVKNITDCGAENMKGLGMDEEKWFVKKKELLEIKTELENNYQEYIEFLHYKQKIECEQIEAEIDKIEENLTNCKGQTNKNQITNKENETTFTKYSQLINRSSEENINDTLPALHSPHNLQQHLPFIPSPTDVLCTLSPSLKPIEIEFIKSTKRGEMSMDGQEKENVTYWRCEKRPHCNGTLVTKNGKVTKKIKHNHPPDPDRSMCLKTAAGVTNKTAGANIRSLINCDSEEITDDILPPLHPPPTHSDISPSIKPIEMEIIESNRRGRKLLLDGYAFMVNKEQGGFVYWRCEKRTQCKGSLVTKNEQVTKRTEHTHPPDPVRNICLKALAKMRLEAQISSDITGTIIHKNLSLLPLEAVTSLPTYAALAHRIQGRRRALSFPISPSSLKTEKKTGSSTIVSKLNSPLD